MKINENATTATLLDQYNVLAEKRGLKTIASWKQSKAQLIQKLIALKTETLGALVNVLLTQVVETSDKGLIGHSYAEILDQLKVRFPKAVTTSRTLAWYATQLRNEGIQVPHRPRAKKAKVETEVEVQVEAEA